MMQLFEKMQDFLAHKRRLRLPLKSNETFSLPFLLEFNKDMPSEEHRLLIYKWINI